MKSLSSLNEELLERICAGYDCALDELFQWEEDGDVRIFSGKNALADWLYLEDQYALKHFVESALSITKEDFDNNEQSLMDVLLDRNGNVYIDDMTHLCVYVHGIF